MSFENWNRDKKEVALAFANKLEEQEFKKDRVSSYEERKEILENESGFQKLGEEDKIDITHLINLDKKAIRELIKELRRQLSS